MLARVIFALVALVGVADAFVAPGAFVVRSKVAAVDGPVMMAKGKVNPALFATGIDPKKAAAIKKAKADKKKEEEKLTKAGLPIWNLSRLLPQRAPRTTDGSLTFPKPWGDQWGSPNFDKTRFK